MLTTIIIVLLILWALGAFGPLPIDNKTPVHTLLVVVLILVLLRVTGVI